MSNYPNHSPYLQIIRRAHLCAWSSITPSRSCYITIDFVAVHIHFASLGKCCNTCHNAVATFDRAWTFFTSVVATIAWHARAISISPENIGKGIGWARGCNGSEKCRSKEDGSKAHIDWSKNLKFCGWNRVVGKTIRLWWSKRKMGDCIKLSMGYLYSQLSWHSIYTSKNIRGLVILWRTFSQYLD